MDEFQVRSPRSKVEAAAPQRPVTNIVIRLPRIRPRNFFIAACLLVIAGAVIAAGLQINIIVRPTDSTTTLPGSVTDKISGFTPYGVRSDSNLAYTITASSVIYQSGVLVFELKTAGGKRLAFTEQATPEEFDRSVLGDGKGFKVPAGLAYLTDNPEKTTASVLTDNNTWIIINAPSPIGAEAMTAIVKSLVAIKH